MTPFVEGFSRCIDEVNTFLENQRELLPEVRQKLVSHCREQLVNRNVDLPKSSVSSPIEYSACASPVKEEKSPVDTADNLVMFTKDSVDNTSGNDNISNLYSSRDETMTPELENLASSACDKKMAATVENHALPTSTYVAPFYHTPSLANAAQLASQKTAREGNGLKVAGPLKLICGGNVFIVMEQENGMKGVDNSHFPLGRNGGQQLVCGPSFLGGNNLAYLPAVPQMAFAAGYTGISTSSVAVPPTNVLLTSKLTFSNAQTETSLCKTTATSRAPNQSPEVSFPCIGNDVNNNHVHLNQQSSQPMWRPW